MIYRKNWYPFWKKIVPRTFSFSTEIVKHMYLGDGSLDKRYNRVRGITLATCSFSKTENYWLIDQLQEVLDLTDGITLSMKKGSYGKRYPCIYLRQHASNKFFDYIGHESPFNCFEHKFP